MKNSKYITLALGVAITTTGGANIASAEEVSNAIDPVPTTTSAQVPTPTDVRPTGALQGERAEWAKKMRAEKEALRNKAKEARGEVKEIRAEQVEKRKAYHEQTKATAQTQRADIKSRLEAATTDEERKAIMEEAKGQRAELKGEVKEKREEFRAENQSKREELKSKAVDRLKAHLVHIEKRLDHALGKVNTLTNRIQDYLDKKSERGVDVSAAQAALDASSTAKDTAKAKVAEVKTAIQNVVTSDKPREVLKTLRPMIKDATQIIKVANKEMKEAIRLARGLNSKTE